MSLSVDPDVVGHEIFHGVTESDARLEYAAQSGALNESYSDVFAVISANNGISDPREWNWRVGEGLGHDGNALRDMKDPGSVGQPARMQDLKSLPLTENGDWHGSHPNSGIHNKAAYNVLTATDSSGRLLFTPGEVAAIFYIAQTRHLSRTSQFADSRRAVMAAARTLFHEMPEAKLEVAITALESAFSAVGIR